MKIEKIEVPMYTISLVREQKPALYCNTSVDVPDVAAKILQTILANADREYFLVLALDSANKVIGANIVSQGVLNYTLVCAREVFKAAFLMNAATIIVGHNHPSGDLTPSQDDIKVTKKLAKAGKLLGITVLDHIIVGSGVDDFFSFKNHWFNLEKI